MILSSKVRFLLEPKPCSPAHLLLQWHVTYPVIECLTTYLAITMRGPSGRVQGIISNVVWYFFYEVLQYAPHVTFSACTSWHQTLCHISPLPVCCLIYFNVQASKNPSTFTVEWPYKKHMAASRFAFSQWDTALLCKDVSHWLGAAVELALKHIQVLSVTDTYITRQHSTQSVGNMPPPSPRHLLQHVLQIMPRNPKYDQFQPKGHHNEENPQSATKMPVNPKFYPFH